MSRYNRHSITETVKKETIILETQVTYKGHRLFIETNNSARDLLVDDFCNYIENELDSSQPFKFYTK